MRIDCDVGLREFNDFARATFTDITGSVTFTCADDFNPGVLTRKGNAHDRGPEDDAAARTQADPEDVDSPRRAQLDPSQDVQCTENDTRRSGLPPSY